MYHDLVLEQLRDWYMNDPTCPNVVGDAVELITLLKLRVAYLEREISRLENRLDYVEGD